MIRKITLCFMMLIIMSINESHLIQAKPKAKPRKAGTSTSEIDKLAESRLSKIEALEAKSANNKIVFTSNDYESLVLKNPRPYDVVMLFNVRQNCEHCTAVENEYEQLIYSFIKERGKGGATKGMEKEKKIFFGVFYFSEDRQV